MTADLKISGCTAQHQGDRSEQQDRVALLSAVRPKRCALGVLADGVGGMSGGALAADNAIAVAQQRFEGFHPGAQTPEQFFGSVVGEIHTVLRLAGVTSRTEPHSTLAAVLVQPDRIDWCHVGDSRVYLFRDGRLLHCTRDDTLGAQLIDQGTLVQDRAHLHRAAGHLVNVLGAAKSPVPTLGGLPDPQAGDSLLLCSDGLWAYASAEELADLITRLEPREAATQLIALARARANGRGDNCSMVILKIEG